MENTPTEQLTLVERVRKRSSHQSELVMCVAYLIGGLVVLGGAPSSVDKLGPILNQLWVAMLIFGPILNIAGLLTKDQWIGGWLRISGGVGILGALGAFAAVLGNRFGPTFTNILVLGLIVATAVSVIRDALLLRRVERVVRKEG